ncbi:MAG: 50S ribosomal protein L21 [Candidatus Omnitrophota bacterium]|jgi:large subunit ribosomal protein L21
MYAIVEVGAKQFKVAKGEIIEVEKLIGQEGTEIALKNILLVSKDKKIEVGTPYLKEAKVTAVILEQIKGEKVTSYKYRRRKASHWEKGHRQQLTKLKIKEIELTG